jgi:C1A family cysteine protease
MIPATFSWLDRGIMTSVKDQNLAQCGSCWAFAAVGVFEALISRSNNQKVNLSEQQLVNCVPECSGCDGGNGFYAHLYMVENGIVRENVYPYLAMDWECDLTEPSEFYLTKAWNYRIIEAETQAERRNNIKYIIMNYGPVDSVMAVYEDFYYSYKSGVYQYDRISPFRTYHGVVIVGWVDDDSFHTGGYWIVKNCWGKSWGENGYFRIAFDPLDYNIIEFDIRYSLYNGLGNDPLYFEDMEEEYQGYEGRELTIADYATDPDGDTITYTIQGSPQGMSLDQTTGTITWNPDYTQAGDYSMILTISDGIYSIPKKVVINIINVKKIEH